MAKSSPTGFAILKMRGLDIPGRVKKISLDLGELEGVREVEFNYILDIITVRFDPNKLTLGAIRNTCDGTLE